MFWPKLSQRRDVWSWSWLQEATSKGCGHEDHQGVGEEPPAVTQGVLEGAGHTFMNVVCIFRYVAFSPAPPAPRSALQEGRQPPPLPLLLLFWTNERRPVQNSAGSVPCSPTSRLTPSSSKTGALLAEKQGSSWKSLSQASSAWKFVPSVGFHCATGLPEPTLKAHFPQQTLVWTRQPLAAQEEKPGRGSASARGGPED